jgi:pimeloyl-ACP methyl ester carboxylesterase
MDTFQPGRRSFVATAATMVAAPMAALTALSARAADSGTGTGVVAGAAAFARVKQIDAGLLSHGYVEMGPAGGPPVLLFHGWPYDIHSYIEVAPLLAQAGYRVIVPYARGYGTTRFLSPATLRNGQPAALAQDAIDLMDALGIQKATVAGSDWGARTACMLAAYWPERCTALVSVSGYLLVNRELNLQPLPPRAEFNYWWYQY